MSLLSSNYKISAAYLAELLFSNRSLYDFKNIFSFCSTVNSYTYYFRDSSGAQSCIDRVSSPKKCPAKVIISRNDIFTGELPI